VKIADCIREQDVLDALASGRWPERVEEDLRHHVGACENCADLVEVVRPILDDRDHAALLDAHIPSSAVMWWRAQRRARCEAAREAARPITVAQIIGSVTAVILATALLTAYSPWLRGSLARIGDALSHDAIRFNVQSVLLTQGWLLPAVIIGISLVLAPLAVYFAVADD
jgi:hypothetical protein